MIVITHKKTDVFHVLPGDTFNLTVSDATKQETVISEQITEPMTIDFTCSFRFALEDGTVPGFHLSGFFGNSRALPPEMENAVLFEDLPYEKKKRFADSCGVQMWNFK